MRRRIVTALGVFLTLAVMLALIVPVDVQGQSSRTRVAWLIASKLTVSGDAAVTGDLAVTGTGAVTGDLTTSADVSIGDDLNVAAQTGATITQAGSLTPAGTYQPISAAGAVSFNDITAGSAGDVLVLINTGANTITITDTGTIKLSGNAALGQYDSILLWSDGTNWIEVGQADN